MEMLFSCPRCTGAHLASQNQLFGSLAENGRLLNKPLIWKCYFPVPAALVPIWRPKIGIWEARCTGWCPFGVPKSEFGSLAEHFDISNGKLLLGLLLPNSAYKRCHLHKAAGGSRGSPPISTAPMARNTENPRFSWKTARKRSVLANCTIFAVLRVSSNFDISNEKLVLGFLLPNSAYKMCHTHKACRRKEKIDVSLVLNPKRSRSGWCAAS